MKQEIEEGKQDELSAQDAVQPSMRGWLQRSWRNMSQDARTFLIGVLVLVCLVYVAPVVEYWVDNFIHKGGRPTLPTPPPTPTYSAVPVPISISLPGGWVFPLKIGHVDPNGTWNPQGAEWLEGTEVRRFVSLPWTVQLEAVLRTLKSNHEIKLSMSNYDSLLYKVQSVEQVPSSDISKLATDNSPGLLVVLSKNDTDPRWVLTAKP